MTSLRDIELATPTGRAGHPKELGVVIVDDEPLALDRLQVLLGRLGDAELLGRAAGCQAAVPLIQRTRPDLVLLDIQMRDGTAFDLLEALPDEVAPMVVFVTAFPRFACRAFSIDALDYLLKPVEQEQLEAVLGKARRRFSLTGAEQRAEELQRIVEALRADNQAIDCPPTYQQEIWVRKRGTDHVRVPLSSVDWIGVQEDYACLYEGGREHLLRASLDKLARSLDPQEFVRIHRSVVVRRDRIAEVRLLRKSVREVELVDGTCLPIGRIHASNLSWHRDYRHEQGTAPARIGPGSGSAAAIRSCPL